MANQTFNKIKIFFNKKPVRIIIALLVIAAIMTGVSFAIIALLHAISPKASKCQHDTIEINGKCYNSICQNSCSEVVGQHRDLSTPPLCPCICESGQEQWYNPNESRNECVDTCNGSLCANPLDEYSCVIKNRSSTDSGTIQCNTDYTLEICSGSEYEKVDGHYVVCGPDYTCSSNKEIGTFCKPKPSGTHCSNGEVNGCPLDSTDFCKDVYNTGPPSTCKKFSEDDWRRDKFGYCDNTVDGTERTEPQVKLSTGYCAPIQKLSKSNNGLYTYCRRGNPCDTSFSECSNGCCNDVCKKKGNCKNDDSEIFLNNCDICSRNQAYDCSPPESSNCESCCVGHVVKNQCHILCENPFQFSQQINCQSDNDCSLDDHSKPISSYYSDIEAQQFCIGGKCRLSCGQNDSMNEYGCINDDRNSNKTSLCYKQDICDYNFQEASDPITGSGTMIPPDSEPQYKKMVCYKESSGDNPSLNWKPTGAEDLGYIHKVSLPLMPSFGTDRRICTSTSVYKSETEQAGTQAGAYLRNQQAVKDVTLTPDSAIVTYDCDGFNEIIPPNPIRCSSPTVENFSNINFSDGDQGIIQAWSHLRADARFPTKSCIAGTWNPNTGTYSENHQSCVSDSGKQPNKCKYLSDGTFCMYGSFDGLNCISKNQYDNYKLTDLCPPLHLNGYTNTTYNHDKFCYMPYNSQNVASPPESSDQGRNWGCPNTINGFGTDKCCNNGTLEIKEKGGFNTLNCLCPGFSNFCPDYSLTQPDYSLTQPNNWKNKSGYSLLQMFLMMNEVISDEANRSGSYVCKMFPDSGCTLKYSHSKYDQIKILMPNIPWTPDEIPPNPGGGKSVDWVRPFEKFATNTLIIMRLKNDIQQTEPLYLNLVNVKDFSHATPPLGVTAGGYNSFSESEQHNSEKKNYEIPYVYYRCADHLNFGGCHNSNNDNSCKANLGNIYTCLCTGCYNIAQERFHSKIYVDLNNGNSANGTDNQNRVSAQSNFNGDEQMHHDKNIAAITLIQVDNPRGGPPHFALAAIHVNWDGRPEQPSNLHFSKDGQNQMLVYADYIDNDNIIYFNVDENRKPWNGVDTPHSDVLLFTMDLSLTDVEVLHPTPNTATPTIYFNDFNSKYIFCDDYKILANIIAKDSTAQQPYPLTGWFVQQFNLIKLGAQVGYPVGVRKTNPIRRSFAQFMQLMINSSPPTSAYELPPATYNPTIINACADK